LLSCRRRDPARGTGDFAFEVAVGYHGDELVDGVLAGREGAATVSAGVGAALNGLAGAPVLAVGDVLEIACIRRIETFLLDGFSRKELLAFDGGPVRREGMRRWVIA
jgi:hypothetical protein